MNTTTVPREKAKAHLREVLAANGGDTKHEAVIAAIEQLVTLNPTSAPTAARNLLEANWLLINAPNFPDRQSDPQGRYIYTLGRLAFNMFEPKDLLVEIEQVLQPVFPTEEENELTHDIVVKFKTIDDRFPELKGIVKNLALCQPKDNQTVQVQFTGGELRPQDTSNPDRMQQWLSVFGQDNQQFQPSFSERVMSWFLQWKFGMTKTSDIDARTGIRTFAMKKSPKGDLKILYLDDELRITRGNRETVLICQRQTA